MTSRLTIFAVEGIPEVKPGDDLADQILGAITAQGDDLLDGDIMVITQKIVSKSEGRVVDMKDVVPSPLALDWAQRFNKDPRNVELVLRESKRIVRMERGVIISETSHGFICANAGVDNSNVAADTATLLPIDSDASAERMRAEVGKRLGINIGVVISDTFGRVWREGQVNFAIGVAGVVALNSFEGQLDPVGYELRVTKLATADELAGAAELVMSKLDRAPVAIVRGLSHALGKGSVRDLVRPPEMDMFR